VIDYLNGDVCLSLGQTELFVYTCGGKLATEKKAAAEVKSQQEMYSGEPIGSFTSSEISDQVFQRHCRIVMRPHPLNGMNRGKSGQGYKTGTQDGPGNKQFHLCNSGFDIHDNSFALCSVRHVIVTATEPLCWLQAHSVHTAAEGAPKEKRPLSEQA